MESFIGGQIVGLVIGVPIGFIVALVLYWGRVGQFKNELKSLVNLTSKRFHDGEEISVKAGARLKSYNPAFSDKEANGEVKMLFARDLGVGWIFRSDGWTRSRVIHASIFKEVDDGDHELYVVSHFDIK